jgi:hypothetical protein
MDISLCYNPLMNVQPVQPPVQQPVPQPVIFKFLKKPLFETTGRVYNSEDGFLIRCETRNVYMLFESYDAYNTYFEASTDRTFHEVIIKPPQRLKFDIDYKCDTLANLEEPFNTIISAIKDAFYISYNIDLNNICVCDASGPDDTAVDTTVDTGAAQKMKFRSTYHYSRLLCFKQFASRGIH